MSELTILNPLFVSLLPLAALPILFHLFFRLKKRPRPFPSLMFFRRLDPQLNARRRLRHWLILLLRTLLVAALLLALARPSWRGIGREGTVALALVLDNSGSMSGRGESGQTKLKLAVAAARDLVSRLRPNDAAGLVLFVDDPSVTLPPGLVSDKAALLGALDRLPETEASGSVARALERAETLLENSSASSFEIHIFSDLQEDKWNQAPVGLRAPRAGTRVVVHRLRTPTLGEANVSLLAPHPPARPVPAGRRFPLAVALANTTSFNGKVRLNWLDDAGNRNSQEVEVPAVSDKTINITLESPNPGFHWANLWLEGDGFAADNRAAVGYFAADKTSVTFLGEAAAFGLLPAAVSPFGDGRQSGLVPQFLRADGWRPQPNGIGQTFVVLSWDALTQAKTGFILLRQFLESGEGGLLVPSTTVLGSQGQAPAWLGVSLGNFEHHEDGLPVRVLNPSAPIFQDLRDEKGDVALHNLKVFKFYPLRLAPNDAPLLGLADGRVLLAEHRVGRGTLFASGLAFEPGWSNLPLKPGFLALAQGMALAAKARASSNLVSLVAGEGLASLPARGATVRIQSLAGSPLDWKGNQLPGFPRSGVYSVRAGSELTYVAVRSSDREGHARFLTSDQLPALGKLDYTAQTLMNRDSPHVAAEKSGRSFDLALPLLCLALAALLAEGWLANPLPLRRAAHTRL